jgi:hypothetical protein
MLGSVSSLDRHRPQWRVLLAATEEALLRLLRVKHRLLNLGACDQNIDPPDHSLIGDPRNEVAVMLDLCVEIYARVAHCMIAPSQAEAPKPPPKVSI